MRFSRHAKNRMRLHGLAPEEVAAIARAATPATRDSRGRPIFAGRIADGRQIEVVMALDEPDFVITVFGEVD